MKIEVAELGENGRYQPCTGGSARARAGRIAAERAQHLLDDGQAQQDRGDRAAHRRQARLGQARQRRAQQEAHGEDRVPAQRLC